MRWQEICDDPSLRDLPYKIETNEYGEVVMSPVKTMHSYLQGEIARLLAVALPDGKAFPELAIDTPSGVKVPDVVWVSNDKIKQVIGGVTSPIAPEICVEVLSGCNTQKQMADKMLLYFAAGALEVWLCSESGDMTFYDLGGQIWQSGMAPGFPTKIEL